MITATDLAVRNAEAALSRALVFRDAAQNQRWAASLTEHLAASAASASAGGAGPTSPSGGDGSTTAHRKGRRRISTTRSAAATDPGDDVWVDSASPRGDGILSGIIGPGHNRRPSGLGAPTPIDDSLSDVASVAGGSLLSYAMPLSPRSTGNTLSQRGGSASVVGSIVPSPNAASAVAARGASATLLSSQLTPTAASAASPASSGFTTAAASSGTAAPAAGAAPAAAGPAALSGHVPPAAPSPPSTAASAAGVAFASGGPSGGVKTTFISPGSGAPPLPSTRLPTPRRPLLGGSATTPPSGLPTALKSPLAAAAARPPTPRPEQAALRARLRTLTAQHFEASDRLQTTQARLEVMGIPLQPPLPQPSPFPPAALAVVASTMQSVDVAAKLGRAASRLLAACSKVVDAGTGATEADEALQVS